MHVDTQSLYFFFLQKQKHMCMIVCFSCAQVCLHVSVCLSLCVFVRVCLDYLKMSTG